MYAILSIIRLWMIESGRYKVGNYLYEQPVGFNNNTTDV